MSQQWPAGSYEGDLGFRTMKFWNGNKYSGQWVADKFEGYGEYTWEDGRVFRGEFTRTSKIEGKGIAYWPDGRIADRRPAQWPWHFIIG